MKIEIQNEQIRAVLNKLQECMVYPEKTKEDYLVSNFIYKVDFALFCDERKGTHEIKFRELDN